MTRHEDDSIGQKERLDNVVRDEHDGHLGLGNDLIQQLLHAPARFCVEGAERLVHERRAITV
jgi:hypothetical protein